MNQRARFFGIIAYILLFIGLTAATLWFSVTQLSQLSSAAADMEEPASITAIGINAQMSNTGVGGRFIRLDERAPLPTIPPWPTMQNTPTISPAPLPALEKPAHTPINGIPWEAFIVLPPEVISHARQIFALGQSMGRNPAAYSKVGDSTTENPHFMARFDEGTYNLGAFAYLEPAVAQFRGSHNRDSVSVQIGLHSWSANDPMWADPALCLPNETPVQCELRIHNPSILLIRLGTNDVGVAESFEGNISQIVDTALAAGVIPVIGTKGDRHEGDNTNNEILRRIAADYRIPLWDYDRIADTLPARGLDVDGAHMMTYYAHDYRDPTAFTRGHAMHNLTALMMLDALWREVSGQ